MFKFNQNSFARTLFISLPFLIVLILNIIGSKNELQVLHKAKQIMPHKNIGSEFEGLKPDLKNYTSISYYSDNLTNNDKSKELLAQAQYALAPTILDDKNLDHELLLLVCSNPAIALQKAKELGYTPLKANNKGMILARKNL